MMKKDDESEHIVEMMIDLEHKCFVLLHHSHIFHTNA